MADGEPGRTASLPTDTCRLTDEQPKSWWEEQDGAAALLAVLPGLAWPTCVLCTWTSRGKEAGSFWAWKIGCRSAPPQRLQHAQGTGAKVQLLAGRTVGPGAVFRHVLQGSRRPIGIFGKWLISPSPEWEIRRLRGSLARGATDPAQE